jgi:signal transduction histidine kinase/FixJ family two-component response regulator
VTSKPGNLRPTARERLAAARRALRALGDPKHSVTGKLLLVVLLTTAIAFVIAGASLLITNLRQDRQAWQDEISTAGSILALATAPALSFEDAAGAQRTLAAASDRPAIRVAALYRPDRHLYARYVRTGEPGPPASLPSMPTGVQFDGGRVELLQPVNQNGETLGFIYLRARYDLTSRIWTYAGILLAVMVLGLVAALLAGAWLQAVITGPIGSIANVAREIMRGRDYSLRASQTTDDEFGVVVGAFNNMLEEVEQRSRALESSNSALHEQVAVAAAAERALRDSERALREADRRKDEFLATLAHELRNPLAPIRNSVHVLASAAADAQQRLRAQEVIGRQTLHMALLLDDLLDVSRVTRGVFELKKEYVELRSVCDAAAETARPLIQSKQHTLTIDLPDMPLILEADPLRLAQVISNLLTNAAKYTDPGGRIELSARLTEELQLRVVDTGIGLAPESIPRIFTIFSQVDPATDRAQGGLGIGLALVRGLVALHGGTVEARSAGLGCGSEFLVHLPATIIAASEVSAAAIQPSAGEPAGRPCKILIADDNRDAVDSMATALRLSGYEVTVAFSGAEALEAGAREHPRVVILDIGMPGMDGYETARRLRLEAWGHHAIVVALTGWGQESDRRKAIAAGFDTHVTKPVNPSDLEETLVSLLDARDQRTGATDPHAAVSGESRKRLINPP